MTTLSCHIESKMVLPSYKRVNIVDFPQADQALVNQLAGIINIGFDNVYLALGNRITFADNFEGTQKTFNVTVDSTGKPTSAISFALNVANNTQARIIGTIVVSAVNSTSATTPTPGSPFVNYTQNGSNIQINNITGLTANQQYSVT